ncbi:MAG: hypothetical protein IPM54_35655 [Polyangiaceae bacterium]|nr:hypothetical protein [Polyangiaceae bacterium]
MSTDVELRCACGAVQGFVSEASPATINRAVCYCDDCQAFARFLGRYDIMNDRGGTDIVQVAPSRVRIVAGADKLRAMRLSQKGVFRAYTDCCKTPAGNSLYSPRTPFVGFATRFFVLQGSELDAAVGASLGGIHGRLAIGGCPPGVHERAALGLILRSVGWLLGNAFHGRHKPSPFWTASGEPTVAVHVLSR